MLPAAGLGTRMRALTGGAPKELLPLGGRPLIAHVVDEMRTAGASRVVVVGSVQKPGLDDWVTKQGDDRLVVTHQRAMRGLADAVVTGVHARASDAEVVVVANADSVLVGASPVPELVQRVSSGSWDAALALREVPDEVVSRYGIAQLDGDRVTELVEKPSVAEAPSRWAIGGRYALSASTVARLAEANATREDKGEGEFGLTEWLSQALGEGLRLAAVRFAPGTDRLDGGSPEGYRDAVRTWTER